MKNLTYLAAAYGIVWAGLFSYLWYILSKQSALISRIRALEDSD
jgi:CcmD family protein